jgi:hypothetical protein
MPAFLAIIPVFIFYATSQLGRKILTLAGVLVTFIAITTAFVICIKNIIIGVNAVAHLPPWLSLTLVKFLPTNFTAVVSKIFGAHACRWAYDKAIEKIKLINSAT